MAALADPERQTSRPSQAGPIGPIAALLVVTGLHVGFVQAARFVEEGRNAGFLIVPIGVLAGFVLAFSLAIAFRRKPALHKRWMVIAHCTLLEPAAARALSTFDLPVFPAIIPTIAAPLIVGAIYDAATKRSVPWLFLAGIALVIGSGFIKQALAQSPGWIAFAERVVS